MHEKPPVADLPVFCLVGGQLSSAYDTYGDLNGWFVVRVEDGGELVSLAARPGHDATLRDLG